VAEELVDTAEAAAILNCSPQWVGRIRGRLGVREIGSQRVFTRQTVVEYAERKAGQHK
jgi:helix-turn-helix protein